MKRLFCVLLFFVFTNNIFSQNYLEEIKIGIYAKDLKKIYTNLINHFGEDFSEIHPEKFIDFANWLINLEDYSSAYQFYMIANVATFQNDKLNLDEKNKLMTKINHQCDSLMKKISPVDKLLIEKNKYRIFPERINLMSNLALMLSNTEKIKFDTKPTKIVRSNPDGIAPITMETVSGGITFVEEQKPVDEAPYYDYRDIIENLVYPEKAIQKGIEGTVKVEVVINELGNVLSKKVLSSDNEFLNSYALNVIDYVKFSPGKRDSNPIQSKVIIPVHFTKK
jgi:TonB family protein